MSESVSLSHIHRYIYIYIYRDKLQHTDVVKNVVVCSIWAQQRFSFLRSLSQAFLRGGLRRCCAWMGWTAAFFTTSVCSIPMLYNLHVNVA